MSTVFRVEKTANYTVMSNTHLKDRRLSFKAKGLLSVILSLPPDWDYTVTGLAVIAADGVDSVKTAVKELEKYGYIVRKQLRDELGRMARNEYRVYESPDDNPDFVSEEQKTAENPAEKPMQKGTAPKKKRKESQSVYPSAENPPADKSAADNPEAGTIQKLNNNILNTDQSIHSFTPAPERSDGNDRTDKARASAAERKDYREIICSNISYDEAYANNFIARQQVDELVEIMIDVVCSSAPTIRVNGEDVPQEIVKSRFLKLTQEEIDYVLYALEHNSSRIGNVRSYLITALYNSKVTVSNYFSNMAYNDIREGKV